MLTGSKPVSVIYTSIEIYIALSCLYTVVSESSNLIWFLLLHKHKYDISTDVLHTNAPAPLKRKRSADSYGI